MCKVPTLNVERALFTHDLIRKAGEGIQQKEFDFFDFQDLRYTFQDARKLNNFTLIHVENGAGRFNLALDDYIIKSRTAYFAYPGQLISNLDLRNVTGYLMFGSQEFMLKANPQLLDMKLFQLYGRSHEVTFTEEEHLKLKSIAGNISSELNSPGIYRRDKILQNLINLHVFYTDRFIYNTYYEKEKEMHPKVRGFFALMNLQQNVNQKVTDYSSELNIAPNYLNQLVKDQTGKSVKTLVKEKTIRQACVYLLHTDEEVKEIAYRLEYNYPQYFIRDFKNAMGITPVQYRRANR